MLDVLHPALARRFLQGGTEYKAQPPIRTFLYCRAGPCGVGFHYSDDEVICEIVVVFFMRFLGEEKFKSTVYEL